MLMLDQDNRHVPVTLLQQGHSGVVTVRAPIIITHGHQLVSHKHITGRCRTRH